MRELEQIAVDRLSIILQNIFMKFKIENITNFKNMIMQQTLNLWSQESDLLQNQLQDQIDQGESKALLVLSEIKSAYNDLKSLAANPIPQQDDDLIKAFSLFDLTVSSAGNSNTTTFFILPIQKIPQKFGHIKIDGLSIVLDTRQNPFIGKALKYRATSKPGALWNDSPWHPTFTGEHSKGGTSTVSWIYK